ncbi:MAG TPA: DNA polymerase ligase N-terminal domain-containing protein [Gemmatimonadaceae bacterium]|nr:DNA polymerase ligase N-terminal domain-containing protein [Gemmatimonadaceae bacterium]
MATRAKAKKRRPAAKKRSLTEYKRKRDFATTAEPEARRAPRRKQELPIFVVQHHKASHDHHDFRLEHDGVLLSWAVPKHVSTDPTVKRLAVQVEDHPLDYATFQGSIPEGEYGAGTVKTWDIGTYEPEGDFAEGLEKGKLSFVLHGKKLKGDWTLVRMQPRPGERPGKPQWLLMRHHLTK